MKLACNYFVETEQLFDEKRIDIDYFKYPGLGFHMGVMEDLNTFEEFCNKVVVKRPILLHGLYPAPHDLSSPTLINDFDFDTVNRLIRITKTPGLSFHPTLLKVPFDNMYEVIVTNAKFIKEKFADMEFVSIENLNRIRYGDLIKPETITRLLDETGCEFLLDISHAYYASRALGIYLIDYLKMLPLEKIVEIHINGWVETEKGLMSHTKIHDESYNALKEILPYCNPKIITVEYGIPDDRVGAGCPVISPDKVNNDVKNEIIEQVEKIREIIK